MQRSTAINDKTKRTSSAMTSIRKTSACATAPAFGMEQDTPADLLRKAEEELNAGMYHEALLDADGCIRKWGADDRSLFIRGISRLKYGIPQLYDLGLADLEQAAAYGSERASELLQRLGGVLAA